MQLDTVGKIATQIQTMREAERYRAPQRAILNQFFNGEAPWTKQEAQDNHIYVNFNDKQGSNLLHQARNQYENAFSKRDSFFKVTLPECKDDFADDYASVITSHINRIIKASREFYYTLDEVWGGIVLHGVGARMWHDTQSWKPRFAGIQDLLIPTETHLGMENLQYFAVRRRMRPGELFKKTLARGKNVSPGWNLKAVRKLLDEYKDLNTNPNHYNWADQPEQMAELWKQSSGGYYDSDVAPVIDFWDFYYREEGQGKAKPGWYHKIILDKDCVTAGSLSTENPPQFIFDGKKPIAPSLEQIIHFQFGDGNNVPPFMYHSIRSLSYMVYDLVWMMNRLNCQFTQHLFEQLMTMVRVQDPADRGRLSKVVLTPPFCIIPDGLNLVAGNERYKADAALIESGLSQYRQRIGDLTSAYTQQLDTGTAKERTKFEVQALLAQTSALMSSMLGRAYRQEHWACVEIARRFTIPNSHDFDVKKFQAACIKDGVPRKYLDSSLWQIEVEQVLGNGNRAMELAEASELKDNIALFGPQAQQDVIRKWTMAVTNNPKEAARLVPVEKIKASESVLVAQQLFASLWLGAEIEPTSGLNFTEQATTLLGLMQSQLKQILQGKEPSEQDFRGFGSVAVFVAKLLRHISGNPQLQPVAKQLTAQLNEIMGVVKKIQSSFAANQENGNGQVDPEAMAKVEAIRATTQAKIEGQQMSAAVKAQNSQASTQLKLQQKQQSHQQKLVQSQQSHQLSEFLKDMEARHDAAIKEMETKNDLLLQRIEAALKPKPELSESRQK